MRTQRSATEDAPSAQGRPCAAGPGRALSRLEPWLLLLLAENPAHGYELLERLDALPEAPRADRGHLYRTLRRLEDERLVTSMWEMPQAGAARHTYTLTADGLRVLDAWATHIEGAMKRLGSFLQRRQALRGEAAPEGDPLGEESRHGA